MPKLGTFIIFAGLLIGSTGCTSDDDSAGAGAPSSSGSGGNDGGTGASSGAGGAASGGASGSGGTSNGGSTATGGSTASGSAGTLGSAGSGGGSGAGGASSMPTAGCGKASPPSGDLQMQVSGQSADYIITLPQDYQSSHPYPVVFGFHGRNRTHENCRDGDCAGFAAAMQQHAVLVYMKSLGGTGWESDGERELNVAFFEQVLQQLKTNYCVDESRIFVAGTSSGAHFTNILGCRFGDQLRGVAPVAGVMPEKTGCTGQVAALVIHGVDDYHVPFTSGEEARDLYLERNGCTSSSDPNVGDLHQRVVATAESHECATYAGCDAGAPVIWCEHSEGGYDGSTHGWPKFAGARIWEFVQDLE